MLSSSFRFPSGLTVANRIVKASMTECLAGPDCRANSRLARLYRTFGEGGAGLLLTGNVMVDSRYLEAPGNVAIENDDGIHQLRAWAREGQRDAPMIMQLNHAGRQTPQSAALVSIAPSAVPLTRRKFFSIPREITPGEIEEVIERFAFAARTAERAGFAGVEVHAAHGYLISQFLSPRVNQRADEWGGTITNRARLLRKIVARIRDVVAPSFTVGVKLNVEDFVKGGLDPEDAIAVSRMLRPMGADFLELTGGTHEYPVVFDHHRKAPEPIFIGYALKIRSATDLPLILTGGIRTHLAMERALGSGACDLIGMARPLALEPDLPRRLLSGEAASAKPVALRLPPPPRAALAELVWMRAQLARLAAGRRPWLGLPPKWALLRMVLSDMGFRRRRQRYLARHPQQDFAPTIGWPPVGRAGAFASSSMHPRHRERA